MDSYFSIDPCGFLAREFARLQAPEQNDVKAISCAGDARVIRRALAALGRSTEELALRPFEAGGEVLVPALSSPAAAAQVLSLGLVPVLVDVLPGTLCIDPEAVRAAITDRTVAIIPVHLYDRMAEMDAIMAIAREHGLAVIEDCAHALGARILFEGKSMGAGTVGHVGIFSRAFQPRSEEKFQPRSEEEGAVILASDAELAVRLRADVLAERIVERIGLPSRREAGMESLIEEHLRLDPLGLSFAEIEKRRQAFVRFDAMVREELSDLGVRVTASQPEVEATPADGKVVHVDLSQWGDMTLEQWVFSIVPGLGRVYEPLASSPLWDFMKNPELSLNSELAKRVNPKPGDTPVAQGAYESTGVIAAEAFDAPLFPALFVEAMRDAHRRHRA